MNITYHQDPGHGWLEVPVTVIADLGIADRITPYSYRDGDRAYLEEDRDAETFVQACKERGIELTITPLYVNYTGIRHLPQWRAGA
jgi:hypothetical protein